jgi:hypothetical protein
VASANWPCLAIPKHELQQTISAVSAATRRPTFDWTGIRFERLRWGQMVRMVRSAALKGFGKHWTFRLGGREARPRGVAGLGVSPAGGFCLARDSDAVIEATDSKERVALDGAPSKFTRHLGPLHVLGRKHTILGIQPETRARCPWASHPKNRYPFGYPFQVDKTRF